MPSYSPQQSTQEDGARTMDPFADLQALVADDMAEVNRTILARMDSPVALIPQLAGHLIASGGKRLRPMLTLGCASMLGYQGDRHAKLAASVEFIHTATLLHDDVVDESALRRGQASANTLWGNQASVLVGDFLFSRAFQLMTEDGSLEVLRTLSQASNIIAEGEVLQLSILNDVSTGERAYLDVISAKTAALFAAACRIAAIVAGRPPEEEEALNTYGSHLGIAFQLADDVLDYSAAQAKLGKAVGDDFREGKMTLPVILAFARGDDQEKAFWQRCMGDVAQQDGDLEQALHLIETHGALDEARARARDYADQAKAALSCFADNDARRILSDIATFCVERTY